MVASPTASTSNNKESDEMIEILQHCQVAWNDWCAVWEFVIALTFFVVEFLWHSRIWEDGSWGHNGEGECLRWLMAGCR